MHGVAERRPLADELAVRDRQIGEIPVQPRVEARRETGRDVGGENRGAEEHRVGAGLLDERRERVDSRLRERRRELRRLARVNLGRTERTRAGRDCGRALAEHDAHGVTERRGLREHPEPALLERAAVVLEEHEERHRSFLSTTRSRIFCAAEPSSSIFTWSPREGGGAELEDGRLRACLARRARVHPDVGERQRLLRLRLRAHDPLERRVARLVDRVRDGDDRRERSGDDVVAVLGLALAVHRAVVDGQRRDLRDRPAAAGDRPPPTRARRRHRRPRTARRARDRRTRARALPRAREPSRADRSPPPPRRTPAPRGPPPSRAPCAASRRPSPARATRGRPRRPAPP